MHPQSPGCATHSTLWLYIISTKFTTNYYAWPRYPAAFLSSSSPSKTSSKNFPQLSLLHPTYLWRADFYFCCYDNNRSLAILTIPSYTSLYLSLTNLCCSFPLILTVHHLSTVNGKHYLRVVQIALFLLIRKHTALFMHSRFLIIIISCKTSLPERTYLNFLLYLL